MPNRSGILLGLTCLAAAPLGAQARQAEGEVLDVVRRMLKVLETKDAASVAALVDSTTRFTLLRPGRVIVLTGHQFLDAVSNPNSPPAVELIRNPEVRIDGDLATVWTEYQLIVNGAVSHCGFDAFQLSRAGGAWKLLNVSDSFRNTGCGGPWNAP